MRKKKKDNAKKITLTIPHHCRQQYNTKLSVIWDSEKS
jgi:hypothetical protein